MESTCRSTAKRMRFRTPYTPHSVTVMVLALAFYTQDPDVVRYYLKIFLFPYLSPSTGSEAALATIIWDDVLGENTFTSFAKTGYLLGQKKMVMVKSWVAVYKELGAWTVFWSIFLGNASCHPDKQYMEDMVKMIKGVSTILRAQDQFQPVP